MDVSPISVTFLSICFAAHGGAENRDTRKKTKPLLEQQELSPVSDEKNTRDIALMVSMEGPLYPP